jgi:hypothetical protein
VQVRGLLTREELDRYNALMEVGGFLESQTRYDLVYTVQREVDLLIMPAIERLKEKGRQRDRDTEAYLSSKAAAPEVLDEEEDQEEDQLAQEDDNKLSQ